MALRLAISMALIAVLVFALGGLLACTSGSASDVVVIATNADAEAVEVMTAALTDAGFSGQFVFQEMGTAELGGRLMAEGTSIEADIITLASFYLHSSQNRDDTFLPLDSSKTTLDELPDYMTPILAITGSIFVNTELMEEDGLPMPTSIRDLADPVYAGNLAIADINSSSTAWLLIQAILDNYSEEEAAEIIQGIYRNADAHVLPSGSGPIRSVRAGEVAVGFGLRHTAVNDYESGMPIDFIDPAEGNYKLIEALAVIDRGEDTNPLALEMAQHILEGGRPKLQEHYPMQLFAGEEITPIHEIANQRTFPEPLTLELLEQHQAIVDGIVRSAND